MEIIIVTHQSNFKMKKNLFIIPLIILINLTNIYSNDIYSLNNIYRGFTIKIHEDEFINSEWLDSQCLKNCFIQKKFARDSIEFISLFGYYYLTSWSFHCKPECNSVYCYDRVNKRVYLLADEAEIMPAEMSQEYLVDSSYYFIFYNKEIDDDPKYLEKIILLIKEDKPLEAFKYEFDKNLEPIKIEKYDSLFHVEVYEYETECNWSILHLILPRGRNNVYDHLYINSYLYKFDLDLNLISIDKLPINKKEWEESRYWGR